MRGLLLADKPAGWTSHDVVAAVRRRFPRGTKVGHAGTLDPMATGLLVLLAGSATRDSARLLGLPKAYSGRLRLGVETDTGDMEGRVLEEHPVPDLSEADLSAVFQRHLGLIEHRIPAYSAVKHRGRPLYEYARAGLPAPEKSRRVRILDWRLERWERPEASFFLRCSSGTYVRSLAESAGRILGCGAALSALRREEVGPFRVEGARPAQALKELGAAELEALLLPVPEGLGEGGSA